MLPQSVYTRRVESWYDARSLGATGPAQLMEVPFKWKRKNTEQKDKRLSAVVAVILNIHAVVVVVVVTDQYAPDAYCTQRTVL